ncbi:hypothetical protein [Dyella mobilis]|uniref:YXWGXW repeat-containing protein n=1 Tax=Dyella mobilis TaxID=1849582 RepID=A0ABS2KL63_9GAMM|nr:hypothetical protein [Dyella mobilis]MBM7131517.1 hypothetical protein [Dyella mobilis]GLQ96512.1 hypothetical protein GCM10007863_09300 [Dyella mobilis]
MAVLAALPLTAVVAQDQPPQHREDGQRQQAPAPGQAPGHWQPGRPAYTPGQYGHVPMPAAPYPRGPVGPGAYGHGPMGPGPYRGPGNFHHFAGRDFAHFSAEDQVAWRGGGWRHEFHDGRMGWWWFAGGAWYFYDQPVYPYPAYVSEVVYAEPVEDDQGEEVEPSVAPAPPPPPTGNVYYYCPGVGYYPQVSTCSVPFQTVTN